MARFTVSVNEQKCIDNISLFDYYNTEIVPRRQGFRKIMPERPSGICPFHADTDPSFHIWTEKKIYHCFGCHNSGNIVRLHMEWQKTEYSRYIDKETAIRELADKYGIELEFDEKGELKKESPFAIARKKLDVGDYSAKDIYSVEKITIAGFRKFNNQIKEQISHRPYLDGEYNARLFDKLDLRLSNYLAAEKAKGIKQAREFEQKSAESKVEKVENSPSSPKIDFSI